LAGLGTGLEPGEGTGSVEVYSFIKKGGFNSF